MMLWQGKMQEESQGKACMANSPIDFSQGYHFKKKTPELSKSDQQAINVRSVPKHLL